MTATSPSPGAGGRPSGPGPVSRPRPAGWAARWGWSGPGSGCGWGAAGPGTPRGRRLLPIMAARWVLNAGGALALALGLIG